MGLYKDNNQITDTAFDILSLEALFMVPRLVSKFQGKFSANISKDLLTPESTSIFWDTGKNYITAEVLVTDSVRFLA